MNPIDYLNKKRRAYTRAYTATTNQKADLANIQGGDVNGARDAFRHIYASAQMALKHGETVSHVAGSANEWIKHIVDGNPTQEWQMDEHNNALGRQLAERARQDHFGGLFNADLDAIVFFQNNQTPWAIRATLAPTDKTGDCLTPTQDVVVGLPGEEA